MRLALAGQSYSPTNPAVGVQRLLNGIYEAVEDPNEKAKGGAVITNIPGRTLLKNLTTINASATPIRGLWSGGGRLFVAAGTKFMELNSSYGLVGSVWTIADDAAHTPVKIIPNGNQLLILASGVVYCDNGAGPVAISLGTFTGFATVNPLNTHQLLWEDDVAGSDLFDIGFVGQVITYNGNPYTVQSVTNPQMLTLTTALGIVSHQAYSITPAFTASDIAFMGQYYIASRRASRQINFSAFLDGSTWAGADFAIKESQPDNIRGIEAIDGQLFLLGTESSEAWQQVGNSNVPFARIDGAEAAFGLASTWGKVVLNGKLYFLGGGDDGKPIAYRVDGFTPVRISTHAVEEQWASAGSFDSVVSYGYQENGHYFWVINFTDRAWVWDATSKTWTERQEWDGSTAPAYYDTFFHTFVTNDPSSANNWGAGVHVTGGPRSGKLYASSVNTYDNDGSFIGGLRQLPYNYAGGRRMYFGRMTLECAPGMVASGAAPDLTREYSDDRGHTWSNSQTASLGTAGEYGIRLFWPTGGSSYNRAWRFSWALKSQLALIDCNVEYQEGQV